MKPMKPMEGQAPWWPDDLGKPASSGSQDGMRYAVFPEKNRLAVERDGSVTLYDTGGRSITGISQASGGTPTVSGPDGEIALDDLKPAG